MKRIAVICAMEKEFLLIKEALGDGCGGIIPSLSGIGKVNAALDASAAVAQTCWLENVPFISIRAVSDVHDGRQAERYSGFWDSLADRTFRTVMAIISSVKDYCG